MNRTIDSIGQPWLDQCQRSLRVKLGLTYIVLMATTGAWWIWMCINVTRFRHDGDSPGFGNAFAVNILLNVNRQLFYISG